MVSSVSSYLSDFSSVFPQFGSDLYSILGAEDGEVYVSPYHALSYKPHWEKKYSTLGLIDGDNFEVVLVSTTYDKKSFVFQEQLGAVSRKIYSIAAEASVCDEFDEDEKLKLARAADEAAEILALMPLELPAPVPSVTVDAEIKLRWKIDKKEAVVMFDGDGVYGAAFLNGALFEPARSDMVVSDGFPAVIKRYFSS